MEDLAKAIIELKWGELDDLAQNIVAWATDDNGQPNDERYVSQALLQWAVDVSAESEAA